MVRKMGKLTMNLFCLNKLTRITKQVVGIALEGLLLLVMNSIIQFQLGSFLWVNPNHKRF
jgi:hypothetical protein